MRPSSLLAVVPALAAALTLLAPAAASAAPLQPEKAGAAAATSSSTGNDISYPQCGKSTPSGALFGVVGVNGGNAAKFNPCLQSEYSWANGTPGIPGFQQKVNLYVNTANPGQPGTTTWWPTSDTPVLPAPVSPGPTGPLPTTTVKYPSGQPVGCDTATDPYGPECAYVYGYIRAEQAYEYAHELLGDAALSGVKWWLDVETSNTWQPSTTGAAANAASLGGATDFLTSIGGGVGVYSTTAQYKAILGATGSNVPSLANGSPSPLVKAPEWGAGAPSLSGAQSNCGVTTFTGGVMALTQYVSRNLDYDVSCKVSY
jgi:hypothetical protein